jgi:Sec-independent protein translocase protein TatA
VANQLGEWIGQAKRMTRVMRRQLEEEIDLSDPLDQKSSHFPPEDISRPQFVNNSPDYNERPEQPDSISIEPVSSNKDSS